jgi:hypothetical protein
MFGSKGKEKDTAGCEGAWSYAMPWYLELGVSPAFDRCRNCGAGSSLTTVAT